MSGESASVPVVSKYCGTCFSGLSENATRCHCGSRNILKHDMTLGDPIVPSIGLCCEHPVFVAKQD